jgi:predicted dehydrogenase
MNMKIGIVGAGFAAKYHYECLKRIHNVDLEIAGVTSQRKESREEFGRERDLKVFSNYQDLLNEVDVVDLCVPPYVHEEMIIEAARAGKDVIVEKPLTGYFGPKDAGDDFNADKISRKKIFEGALKSVKKINKAVRKSGIILCYAENFVYAPSIQKEREVIEKTKAQILRMIGEESHNGSHSPVYGIWRYSGGGSLIGKGCHPLGGILYLKRVEGIARNNKPIRPVSVTGRVHQITRLKNYEDKGFIRTDYRDIEDYGCMHIVFEDGTVADVITCELVLGGIYDWVEVFANNHRTRCNLSPLEIVNTYNPEDKQFKDIYLVEKISTKEGWSKVTPDENWGLGYQDELQQFLEDIDCKREPQSNLELAEDTTLTIYAAYLSSEDGGKEREIPRL